MKRKTPQTLRGWAAKYRRDCAKLVAAHAAAVGQSAMIVAALKRNLAAANEKLAAADRREHRRWEAEQRNWSDYDRAVDATTASERELFEASPAYKRYQHLREDRERRGTGDWRLKRGDWRVP